VEILTVGGINMAKTTFAEEIYLRALTGKMIGSDVLAGYNKVAIVAPKNTICSAISAAAEATFTDRTGGRAGHFVVEEGNASQVAEEVVQFNPDAVVLMFGGETPIEQTKKLFLDTLNALRQAELYKDLIVHVRIFAAGGLQEALKDESLRNYLKQNDLFVYTVDFDNGYLLLNEIDVEASGDFHLHRIAEFPVTVEHAELLNRSLRDKTIQWKDM
jgi:hypothetical protein